MFVSKEDDLAFLQIDVKDIAYAKFAKKKPELGDDIYLLSAEPLLLKGIISKIKNDGFMLNVEIPKGSSGGGIFNTNNELIAIALHKDYLNKTSYGVSTTLFKNVKNEYLPSNQLKSLQGNNYDYSHCEDERDLAIWNKHAKSSQLEIQEFPALFVGLCEKVKNRDLTTEQAQLIFENSRNRLFGKE